jgi:hypothetical protein
VRLFELALGDAKGEAEMVMPVVKAVKMQGLSHMVHESIPDNNQGVRYKVKVETIDRLKEYWKNEKISGIKLDVENFEYFVLKGATGLLQEQKPIIYIELWDNENRKKCFDLIHACGYSIHVLDSGKVVPFNKKLHKTQNFFFLPN